MMTTRAIEVQLKTRVTAGDIVAALADLPPGMELIEAKQSPEIDRYGYRTTTLAFRDFPERAMHAPLPWER